MDYFLKSRHRTTHGADVGKSCPSTTTNKKNTMTDLEVIEAFKEQICWGDETTIIEVALTDRQKKSALDSGILIQFPVHWKDFDDLSMDRTIRELCLARKAYLGFIVWGEPSPAEVERIFMRRFSSPETQVVDFLDVQARVCSTILLHRFTDGIDWQRSLENVTKNGVDAAPVWQWD